MISQATLTKLIQKGFVMVGAVPTLEELHTALEPYEHNIYCQNNPHIHRGTIKKVMTNKYATFNLEDEYLDSLMAKLWLEVV